MPRRRAAGQNVGFYTDHFALVFRRQGAITGRLVALAHEIVHSLPVGPSALPRRVLALGYETEDFTCRTLGGD